MAKKKKIAISIFLIAFISGLNVTGIVPVLGILNSKYETQATEGIQILQTLPYVLIMIGSLLVGFFATKLSIKNIATIGLIIVGICGVLPFFYEGYLLLLISRFLIGFGFGVISPLNTAIVAEFFKPEERTGYFGLNVIGMCVGNIFGNLLGGFLANIGYRYFYLVYLSAFISMIGIRAMFPVTTLSRDVKRESLRLKKNVFLISAVSCFYILFITTNSTNIAIYIMEKYTASTTVTGIVTAINAAFALIVGASFRKISDILKQHTLPTAIVMTIIGYSAILWFPGLIGVYVGSACCGISQSCFMARCAYMISVSVEPEAAAKASGIFSVFSGVASLTSPILVGGMAERILGSSNTGNQYLVSLLGMTLLAMIVVITAVKSDILGRKTNY